MLTKPFSVRNVNIVKILSFSLLVVAVLWLVYMSFVESIEVTYNKSQMRDKSGTPKTVFAKNEQMFTYRDVCRSRDVAGFVDREIVDLGMKAVYPLPRMATGVFTGCEQRMVILDLPKNLPSGKYEYRSSVVYEVNALRTQTLYAPPIPFEIE